MGKNNRYVNLTGCASLERINEPVELFKDKSLVSLIENLKIKFFLDFQEYALNIKNSKLLGISFPDLKNLLVWELKIKMR